MSALAVPPRHPRRLAFLGSPEAAVPSLAALDDAGFEVVTVISMPDRRRGRGARLVPTPVKAEAERRGIPVRDDLDAVVAAGPDLGVVVAYGRIIPTRVLEQVPMVNVHFSLLPRWRGAAPVERALLAGDDVTGVCVMQLEPSLDTGAVYATDVVDIAPGATAAQLRAELAERGAALLVQTLLDGLEHAEPQVGEPTYAHKIAPDELRLDVGRSAVELERLVRVGGAWTTFRGERFKVWEASVEEPGASPAPAPGALDGVRLGTADGVLHLEIVQPAGRGRMDAGAWVNGARLADGEGFGP